MYVEFQIANPRLERRPRTPGKQRQAARRLPAVVEQLVLAHQIERAIAEGRARDYASIARQMAVSRARVSQIVALTRLAPAIQEAILLCDTDAESERDAVAGSAGQRACLHVTGAQLAHVTERHLRAIAAMPGHQRQWTAFARMTSQQST